jgi:hypothetical protein
MSTPQGLAQIMDDFNSETDSDYTSYWRDWVSWNFSSSFRLPEPLFFEAQHVQRPREYGSQLQEVWPWGTKASLGGATLISAITTTILLRVACNQRRILQDSWLAV